MRNILISIGLVVFSFLELNGQADIRFENYHIENGLPHSRSTATLQDSKGWIWFGTDGGLSRFDGLEFENYPLDGTSSTGASVIVNCLWEDADSTLWIGTNVAGLVRYERNLDRFTYYTYNETCNNCISSNQVYSIVSDSSGVIWLGTDNGLNSFVPGTNTFQQIGKDPESSPDFDQNDIRRVFIDRENQMWIGTAAGLAQFNMESAYINAVELKENGSPFPINKFKVEEIYQDRAGNLLVGTYNNGLLIIDPASHNTQIMIPDPDNQRSLRVRAIYEDPAGKMWVGTRGGIYIFDQELELTNHLTHHLQDQSSLGHSSVSQIFEDNVGDIWVNHRNGVSHANLRKTAFNLFRAGVIGPGYLNDPEVYCLTQAKDGNIWIGTESGGVNILNRETGQFTYMTHDENNINSLSSDGIKSILEDKVGNFWIGTFLGGLNFYDVKQRKFTHFRNDPSNLNSLANNTVWALHEDREGIIWIGTDGGLDSYDPVSKTFSHHRDKAQLKTVHTIFEDRDGNLFFGSYIDGLTVKTPDSKLTHFDHKVRSIQQDSQGRIWIGSEGNDGLTQIDKNGVILKTYRVEDGLPSNQIFGILEDQNSRLWLSTGQGLSMFDPDSVYFKNYKTEDGIQGEKFYYGSYCKCSSGELLFGGQNGLTSFYPDQLIGNEHIPPIVITNFRIFNKKVPVGAKFDGEVILEKCISETEEISVRYDQAVLTFDFVALNFVNSSKNEYAHMLEGFESEWNYVGSTRSATYTNLDPGGYVLRVKGSNNNGIWNETGTSLQITVTPPFAKTLFFRIFLILLFGLIVYLIILFFLRREKLKNQLVIERVKSKELHKIDMMKFQFFTNISHEIRTPISLIVSPLTRIINSSVSKEQILKDIEVVHRNALRLGKLIDQLLDYRKLEAGKLKLELSRGNIVNFLENTLYMFKEMSKEQEVKLEFYSVLDQIQIYFDPDKIEKVIFNLLSNSFKHTPKGGTIKVAVSLTYQIEHDQEEDKPSGSGEYVQIVVQDTGSGIAESRREKIFERFYQGDSAESGIKAGSGIGLALSKELIKMHKGRISLKSQEGVGTELTILLPAIKKDPDNKELTEAPAKIADSDSQSEVQASRSPNEDLANCDAPIVLILEDNTELLDFIHSIFEEDYMVLTAENGETGLELARETIPDLIISDVMMPKMDGNKLCKKIKEDFRTSHIPVILLTALSSKQHEKEGILGGADEYITKPFDPSLLKIRADQLLATRRLLREKFSREKLLQPHDIATSSPDDKFLAKLVAIVEENIADPEFGTVKISREVGVSRTQLYRKMSALTEMTVKEFIRSIRLKRAAQLIVQEQMNISEAAYSVGFLQVAYFRKCFKEMYGMTPTEYAKKNEV